MTPSGKLVEPDLVCTGVVTNDAVAGSPADTFKCYKGEVSQILHAGLPLRCADLSLSLPEPELEPTLMKLLPGVSMSEKSTQSTRRGPQR